MFKEMETIEGLFIKESKNRFLCEVLIDGRVEECYVPSSSRIENYLNLTNKKVLLTMNVGKNVRTRFSLFAVVYYNKYVLLNLNKVNEILSYYIGKYEFNDCQMYTIKREEVINGYKSDLVIKESPYIEEKIIEAKGIIDIRKETHFPKVHSDRAIKQLTHINSLLESNRKVEYYFISLSPIVKKVSINDPSSEYCKLLYKCIDRGLKVKGISVTLDVEKNLIFKKIKILTVY